MTVRIHLSEWLGKKKWTQKQLAEITGIRPATISALYHEDVKRIEIEQMNELCKAFECQIGDLFEYVPDQKK
ncbi:hypothetical protein AS180_17870 [Priestia veravalensis]|uniref:HTH cro/C1-type domain-containing protein n=1 Tax=Priestia veravalensis TaxID=1414648 RepID=A0A0V8JI72_9BACI|nr:MULTISPECIES: helix-turn-helix transcriptional regulator [Priestia]KSU86557.1 hypothetical protein AS180_17870 [Priestia veravalensis]SCC50653.1 putative transcriptional regulator [Priestia flexa]